MARLSDGRERLAPHRRDNRGVRGMPRLIDKCSGARRAASAAVLATALVLLVGPGSALAGQDELKGGTVSFQLQSSRGLKLKPRALTLQITGGALDPIDGSGSVQVSGSFRAKRGKGKTKVKLTTLTLAPNGGRGTIIAKV